MTRFYRLFYVTLCVTLAGGIAYSRHARCDENSGAARIIEYAGGAVRFSASNAWRVSELPAGREVRLVLSQGDVPQDRVQLVDAVWMSYRHRPNVEQSTEALKRQAHTWLEEEFRQARLIAANQMQLDSRPTVKLHFEAKRSDGSSIEGLLLAVGVEEGLLEVVLVASPEAFASRVKQWQRLAEGMSLSAPEIEPANVPAFLQSARPVVGTWKSLRARLSLAPDGRVVLRFDGKKNYAIDSKGQLDFQRKVQTLTGTFSAEGDVVLITWDDGSQLNYRWKLADGRLLLTDHLGRVSQLERLLP